MIMISMMIIMMRRRRSSEARNGPAVNATPTEEQQVYFMQRTLHKLFSLVRNQNDRGWIQEEKVGTHFFPK